MLGRHSRPDRLKHSATPTVQSAATWSREGVIVFGVGTGLYRVSASGGKPKHSPAWTNPEKKSLTLGLGSSLMGATFFTRSSASKRENSGIYVGSLDSPDRKRLLGDLSNAVYVKAPAQGGLSALPARGNLDGPTVLRRQAATDRSNRVPSPGQVSYSAEWSEGIFAVSENGVLIFVNSRPGVRQTQLTWFDRTGRRLGTVGEPAYYGWRPYLSPDDKQVAVDRSRPEDRRHLISGSSIWLAESLPVSRLTRRTTRSRSGRRMASESSLTPTGRGPRPV